MLLQTRYIIPLLAIHSPSQESEIESYTEVEMIEFIELCAGLMTSMVKSRAELQAENLPLRHQLYVYQMS